MTWAALGGAAMSSASGSMPWKGMSMGLGEKTSPSMSVFGNWFKDEDVYEDTRQLNQTAVLNRMALNQEADSFRQKMALAREHGLHPLAVLGAPMSAPIVSAPNLSGSYGHAAGDFGGAFSSDTAKPAQPSPEDNQLFAIELERQKQALRQDKANADMADYQAMQARAVLQGQAGAPPVARRSNDQVETQSKLTGIPASQIRMGGSKDFAGSGDTTLIEIKPDEVFATRPGQPGIVAGMTPTIRELMTPEGRVVKTVDQKAIQTEVDDGAFLHALINSGVPLDAALAIVGFLPVVGPAVAGAGYMAHRSYRAYKLGKEAKRAADIARRHSWKGGK